MSEAPEAQVVQGWAMTALPPSICPAEAGNPKPSHAKPLVGVSMAAVRVAGDVEVSKVQYSLAVLVGSKDWQREYATLPAVLCSVQPVAWTDHRTCFTAALKEAHLEYPRSSTAWPCWLEAKIGIGNTPHCRLCFAVYNLLPVQNTVNVLDLQTELLETLTYLKCNTAWPCWLEAAIGIGNMPHCLLCFAVCSLLPVQNTRRAQA